MKRTFKLLSLALILVLTTGCGSTTDDSTGEENDNPTVETPENQPSESKYGLYDRDEDSDLINKMELGYDGKTLEMPYTIQDLSNMGIDCDFESRTQDDIEPEGINMGGDYLDIPKESESRVRLYVLGHNITTSNVKFPALTVTSTSTMSSQISMNGVTPGKTTYEEVLKKFGKDEDYRKDTYEEELASSKENDHSMTMEFYADPATDKIQERDVDHIVFTIQFKSDENVVKSVSMEWYD